MKLLLLAAIAALPCCAQRGYLDQASCTHAFGWAWDGSTNARVNVDIYDNGAKFSTVIAALYRVDLIPAGIGDGAHGFLATFALGAGSHAITASVDGVALNDDTRSQGSSSSFTCTVPGGIVGPPGPPGPPGKDGAAGFAWFISMPAPSGPGSCVAGTMPVVDAALFLYLCVDLDGQGSWTWVRTAATVQRTW